jgi:hypothetical protein
VHGGASLQEVVVPVLRVGKQRKEDVALVSVQIIPPQRAQITTSQIQILFWQADPVTEKLQARSLKAGIYAGDGTAISEEVDLDFDFTSENAREREMPRSFLLTRAADDFNNQTVFLKLSARIGKTTRYEEHASQPLQLKRANGAELDF